MILAEKTITSQNSYSSDVEFDGEILFTLSGTWTATVNLEKRLGGTEWINVATFTKNCSQSFECKDKCIYRFGVKTGNYTSGSIVGKIEKYVQTKYSSELYLSDFESISSALSFIGSDSKNLVIDVSFAMTNNITIPSNINTKIINGVIITTTGYTLTL